MSVQYPYLAVICGEEHIVNGWRGENLLTDKGEFVIKQLNGAYAIQSARLLEVAVLHREEKGEWLLNGHNLCSLQSLPFGMRLHSITSGETLRVHKGAIRAIAWTYTKNDGDATRPVDILLGFWKAAPHPLKLTADGGLGEQLQIGLIELLAFGGCSEPIWLTEFHPVTKDNLDTAEVKTIPAQTPNAPVEAVEPLKNKVMQVSQPKPVVKVESVLAPIPPAPEFFTSIKAAAEYAKKSERTIKNWKKDGWLKVEQVGKKIRIAKSDLEKCIKKQ